MNVGRIEYAPDYRSPTPVLEWDSFAREYIERTPRQSLAVETFGEIAVGANRLTAVGERIAAIRAAAPPTTLADLVNYPGFVYVGSPYSKYRDGHGAAAGEVSIVAGALMRMGLVVYAPISHGHYISMHDSRLPQTWEFWKRQCQPMIDAASALVVVTMDGWEESVGLTHEIACFLTARKPVIYADPDETYDAAGGAAGLWKDAA